MTEGEASDKLCPLFHLVYTLSDRSREHPPNVMCKGSSCMFWRWNCNYSHDEVRRYADRRGLTTIDARRQLGLPDDPFTAEKQGYCGMAGKPND